MGKFIFKTDDELQKKVWIGLPDCDLQFHCTQILPLEINKAAADSQVISYDREGNYIIGENGQPVKESRGDIYQAECIELIVKHCYDWKGEEMKDQHGKRIEFSKKNLKSFLELNAGQQVDMEGDETQNVVFYLKSELENPENFTHGDVKNSKPSSSKE